MGKIDSKKVPMPPVPEKVDLFLPITFWSEILVTLDKKVQTLSQNYGFGQINVTIVVHDAQVKEVKFNDEIRIRGLIEKEKKDGEKSA